MHVAPLRRHAFARRGFGEIFVPQPTSPEVAKQQQESARELQEIAKKKNTLRKWFGFGGMAALSIGASIALSSDKKSNRNLGLALAGAGAVSGGVGIYQHVSMVNATKAKDAYVKALLAA